MFFITKIASGSISKTSMIFIAGLLCTLCTSAAPLDVCTHSILTLLMDFFLQNLQNPSAFPLNIRDDKPVISFTPSITDNNDPDQNLKVQDSILKLLRLGNGKITEYTSVYVSTGLTWENYPANPDSLADSGISFTIDGISTVFSHITGKIVQKENGIIDGSLRSSIGASLLTVKNSEVTQAQMKKNPKKKGGAQKASSLPQVSEE
ncbi:hypothetical protein C8J55DRAFT_79777 [Lentinula edodes]|uniref:Uncharacterized protein n=1 Tax=Lentinula lateritia TaxID=40482 RepID=A0A9W9AC70_9AGAR|nr:hypothetical protein C8J55DRAFT_79777 [Lentinula edodes]